MAKPVHPILRHLGIAIRSRRRQRGLSQESLAALASIDRSYMSSVERGLRNVSILSLARIAAALNVPLWELLRPRRPHADALDDQREPPASMREDLSTPDAPLPSEPPAKRWEPRYLSLG